MKATLMILALVFAGAAGFQDQGTIVKSGDAKWVDAAALGAGGKMCVVHGDPMKGASVVLLKIPAGTTVAAHWHSADEVVTVNSGSLVFGWGEKADEAKGTVLDSGSYFTIPAKKAHWAIAKTDTVITKYSAGAADWNACK